ncbi:MAG: reverse transcriptase family protein [Candidatus Nanoarchaeia archaeon]
MGLLKKILGIFGTKTKRYDFHKIDSLLGPWTPYEGKQCLKGTKIPSKIFLPDAVKEWEEFAGETPISTALFPYWLRISPRTVGFLIREIASGKMYSHKTIPREGKAPHEISMPAPALKGVQRKILKRILEQVEVNSAAHGFVRGKSTFSSASPHTGKRVVLKFDLRDFFPSITLKRVFGMFKSLGFDKKRSWQLAALCCHNGKLPQGAPTSPMISNIICRKLDSRLSALMTKKGYSYSRYADDLTFSGDEKIIRMIKPIKEIISSEGFSIAEEKSKIMRSGARQSLLGLNVNNKVAVPRKKRRILRAMIHQFGSSKKQTEKKPASMSEIMGNLAYIKPAHPEQHAALLRQFKNYMQQI